VLERFRGGGGLPSRVIAWPFVTKTREAALGGRSFFLGCLAVSVGKLEISFCPVG